MTSLLRWVSNPTQLSLSYNRDSIKKQSFTAHDKKVLCESFTEHDKFDDYQKLSQFLHLQKREFYPATIKTNSAVDECITFMKDYRKQGYTVFMCIVEYSVFYDDDVYGNHYIIGCKHNDQVCSQMRNLKERKPIYNLQSYPCIILKNYTDAQHHLLERFFPDIIDDLISNPIAVGKIVLVPSKLSDKKFASQITNLRADAVAKDLLDNIRRRLGLSEEYQPTIDKFANTAVSNAFTMLSHCLSTLNTAKDALEVKNIMINMNDQLIIFISNFYFYLQSVYDGGSEIQNHDKIYGILHQLYNTVTDQSYRIFNDVFCVVYSGKNDHYTTPVIYVTKTNVESLLSVFKVKGFTNLKFRLVRQTDDDDNWLIQTGRGTTITNVKFTRFDVPNSPPENDADLLHCVTSCAKEPGINCHWICINCETLVKVNQQAKLMCKCGIAMNLTNPECLKCETKGTSQVAAVENAEVNAIHQKPDASNNEETTVTIPIRRLDADPVSYVVRTAVVTAKFNQRDHASEIETVQQLAQNYKLHATLVAPKPRTYTILVIGSSGAGKSTLLNGIYCMQQHETLEKASKEEIKCLLPVTLEETGEKFDGIHEDNDNEHYHRVGQSVTQHPKDYTLDYGDFKIRFVDTPGISDTRGFQQDADNIRYIQEHLIDLPEVHAILFVIKNSEVKLSAEFENTMLALFGILPRTAVQNCFFMYTFAAPDFQPGSARTPLDSLLTKFSRQQHVDLSIDKSYEYCVDNGILRELLHCQKSGKRFPLSSYDDHWRANSNSISKLFEDVQKVDPISREHFKLAARMKELGDILRPYGKGEKGELTPNVRRLMASVANGSLNGIAIYCRNKSKGPQGYEEPVDDEGWPSVAEFWKETDETISTKAAEIGAVIEELKPAQCNNIPVETLRDIGTVDRDPDTVELQESQERRENKNIEKYSIQVRHFQESAIDGFEDVTTEAVVLSQNVSSVVDNEPDYQSSTSNSVQRSLPPTPLTILVLGRSVNFNSAFLNNIYRGKEVEFEQTANNMSPNKAGTKTDHGYIINYGLFTVDYINMATDGNSSIDWTLYPEIHGFIFVLQSERTYAFESELQKMMAMVPRKAVSNCCIVNIQTSTVPLSKLVNDYRVKHTLEDITHFCIDSEMIDRQTHETRGYIDSLNNIKTNVEEFILKVKESPVTYNDLKLTELFTKLGEILNKRHTYSPQGKRLMASVVENTMSDTARYLRMYPHTATPLTNEEWKDAVNWDLDESLLAIIRDINRLLN